jgi:hypothetical protein
VSSSPPDPPPVLLDLRYVRPGRQEPVEFAQHVEPAVRVVGIPDTVHLPGDVLEALEHLACVCRTAYGLGVEVESGGEREAAVLALETIRRYLG